MIEVGEERAAANQLDEVTGRPDRKIGPEPEVRGLGRGSQRAEATPEAQQGKPLEGRQRPAVGQGQVHREAFDLARDEIRHGDLNARTLGFIKIGIGWNDQPHDCSDGLPTPR